MQVQHELRCLALLAASFACSIVVNGAPSPQSPLTESTTIMQVTVERIGEQAVARITADRAVLPHAQLLSNPDRLVLDFANARLGRGQTLVASSLRPIREIRLGQFKPDVARVVVDLDAVVPYSIGAEGRTTTVTFALANSASSDASPSLAAHAKQEKTAIQAAQVKPASSPSMSKTLPATALSASGTELSVVPAQPITAPANLAPLQ